MVFIKKKNFARKRAWSYSFQKLQYWQFLTKNSSQCDMYLLKRALRENASRHSLFQKSGEMLLFSVFWAILSHIEPFWAIFRSRKHFDYFWSERGRSAALQGSERRSERNSGLPAGAQPGAQLRKFSRSATGARLERNSDFCWSANTLSAIVLLH